MTLPGPGPNPPADHRRKFRLTRNDVDYPLLATQLSTALGRPVALSATAPADAPDRQGELILVDATTGETLGEEVDGEVVAKALSDHVLPPVPRSPAEVLDERLASATTIAALREALREYARAQIRDQGGPTRPR
jgi:hypothetical protein